MVKRSIFKSTKVYGNCLICKQMLAPNTLIQSVKITSTLNLTGYAHANKKECKTL